jgi:hypothetical protein
MIDAIDRTIHWAVFILVTAGLGAFAFFFGFVFWDGLPIVWDGSFNMWGDLWLGVHAIGFFVGTIWFACGARAWRDTHNDWMKKSAKEKARDRLWWLAFLTFCMGVNGFIPVSGDTWTTPLWLTILLTCLGGFGMYQVHILKRDAKS